MQSYFFDFVQLLKRNPNVKPPIISIENKNFENNVQKYSFYQFSDNLISEKDFQRDISLNIKNTNVVIINSYIEKNNDDYFLFGINQALICINHSCLNIFYNLLFKINLNITFCYLSDSEQKIKKYINISDSSFFKNDNIQTEIESFNNCFNFNNGLYKTNTNMIFISTITGYLIQKSYFRCKTNRIYYFFENYNHRSIDKKALIFLRQIGSTTSSSLELYYNILGEQLCVLKKSRYSKLIKREWEYYNKNRHEFMPLCFGEFDETELYIEYIDGETLFNISNFKFNYQQKLKIIFELLIVFDYLHHKGYIYRDLKPNNIIISRNHQIVLIDFDQMVFVDKKNENKNYKSTTDFGGIYTAPEIEKNGMYSFKSDIYSIGCIIFYIMMEKELKLDLIAKCNIDFKQKYNKIYDIYIKCISNSPDQRPSIDELIDYFKEILSNFSPEMKEYVLILKKINDALINNQNISILQYQIGLEYFEGYKIKKNIDMALYYFTLAANQNNPMAQYNLGLIYNEGKLVKKDIDRTLYYFTLAANQNNQMAQFYLGLIYNEGKLVKKNIKRAIEYYKLAADQNIPQAQNNLALIYQEGNDVKQDINKAIYYYLLALKQNNVNAQRNLGNIYYFPKYKTQNVKKAIHYYSLASSQSDAESQFMLGYIYYREQYIESNKKEAINYFKLSADQNIPYAQFYLGMVYYEGKYVKQDINRAIKYFNLSAKQNKAVAQYFLALAYFAQNKINPCIYCFLQSIDNNYYQASFALGCFYQEGKYIKKDIEKSIKFYKDASSFEYKYAKNNLGIIYKNDKKIYDFAQIYFLEAISQKDKLSMYNLAHLYIYNMELIDESINLLIQSSNERFPPLNNLLCIALIKKFKFDSDEIINYLDNNYTKSRYLSDKIMQMMYDENLLNRNVFEKEYEHYKNVVFVYDILLKSVKYSNSEESRKNLGNLQNKNLTKSFYEGLGLFKEI